MAATKSSKKSLAGLARWADPAYRAKQRAAMANPESRARHRDSRRARMLALWADPEYRQRRIKNSYPRGSASHLWKGGVINRSGYRCVMMPGHHRANKMGYVREHLLVVEQITGIAVVKPYEVHHVNENSSDNRPANLVVCPDHAYHMLLHRRRDAYRATGHAHYRRCDRCGQHDDPATMRPRGRQQRMYFHPACDAAYDRQWLARKNARQSLMG